MTQKERDILSLLKKFLKNEISFTQLDKQWIELYIEGEDINYIFEDSLSEIGEFIYWGSNGIPSEEEKSYGIVCSEELQLKINTELKKCINWEKLCI